MRPEVALPLLLFACSDPDTSTAFDPLTAVDPFIGTGGLGFGVGSIVPGPKHPFGLANPAPDTARNGGAPGFSHCAGYYYEDDQIRGFSQIHLSGTGVPDYGALMIMPVTKALDGALKERFYRDRFDHHLEHASVGAYAVHLLDSDVEVEITATPRTALYRLGYPAGRPAGLVVDLAHGLGGGRRRTRGSRSPTARWSATSSTRAILSGRYGGFSLYFAMRFSATPSVRVFSETAEVPGASAVTGPTSAALLDFGEPGAPVLVQIGLSFVDEASARRALDAEWADFDFEKTTAEAREAWRDTILSKVRVEGGSDADRTELYSALYHAYQMPTLLSDPDGRYRGVGGKVGEVDFPYYSDFSLWDTFRTAHPLFSLLTPAIQERFNRSLARMLEDGGHLPRWPLAHGNTWAMLGNHGESMLIDAHLRGVGGFDVDAMYAHLVAAADGPIEAQGVTRAGRECIDSYLSLGYCPADWGEESTSDTLENAYNDWMLGNLAVSLDRTDDAERFHARAQGWRKVFNADTGFTQAKTSAGDFDPDFDPELFSDEFVEGNARQWTVYVPYDVQGLGEAMGGPDRLIDYLSGFFENAAAAEDTIFPDLWYWHGNEVDIHAAYMFSELGRPDLTARWVRWIMDSKYRAGPDGLDGNDDGGTLSAWYVFSAAGFYPIAGSDRYVLGVPRFDRMELDLAGGTLVVTREGTGSPVRVELDGQPIEGGTLRHDALIGAHTLRFLLE